MSASINSVAELPIQNGVGTVGYRVFDVDSNEIVARTTSGIFRIFEGDGFGHYQAKITIVSGVTAGVVVWDDGDGNAVPKPFFIGVGNQGSIPEGDYESELIAEWGGSTSDSYVDLDTANELISKFVLDSTRWFAASGQVRDAAIRMMTVRIDGYSFSGTRLSTSQTLKFPRWLPYWLAEYDDRQQSDIQLATVLGANNLVTYDRAISKHTQNQAFGIKQSSESVGPLRDQYTYTSGVQFTIPQDVEQLLRPYLAPRMVVRG